MGHAAAGHRPAQGTALLRARSADHGGACRCSERHGRSIGAGLARRRGGLARSDRMPGARVGYRRQRTGAGRGMDGAGAAPSGSTSTSGMLPNPCLGMTCGCRGSAIGSDGVTDGQTAAEQQLNQSARYSYAATRHGSNRGIEAGTRSSLLPQISIRSAGTTTSSIIGPISMPPTTTVASGR